MHHVSRAAAVLGAVVACRFDFERVTADGGPGGGNGIDGASPGAIDAAVPMGPFGPAEELVELSAPEGEDDPTLTGDQLEIYFNSDRPGIGGVDIWRAYRADTSRAFSAPELVTELSSAGSDSTPEISADGLTIHLSRTQPDLTVDLLEATRSSRSGPFSDPVLVPELNSSRSEAGGALTADGRTLFLFSDRAGTYDLYVAVRTQAPGPWTPPLLIDELSTGAYDADPCPAVDGSLLAFASDRPGNFDLFLASRPSPDVPFANVAVVSELVTAEEERDPWLSPDGRTLYFERFVGGTPHLYVARR